MATQSLRSVLSLVAAAGIGGLIVSATEGPHRSVAAPAAPMAADGTFGTSIMSAVVRPDGILVRGSGALGSSQPSSGRYLVEFNRPVTNCVFNAMTATIQADGAVTPMLAWGLHVPQQPRVVEINLRDSASGARFSGSFHLLVFCPQ